MNALNVLCAQYTRDLFAIAKFLYNHARRQTDRMTQGMTCKPIWSSNLYIGGGK